MFKNKTFSDFTYGTQKGDRSVIFLCEMDIYWQGLRLMKKSKQKVKNKW